MVAGHDTSATVLTWSVYIFVTDHVIQDHIRAEINALATNPRPTYANLESSMHYINILLKGANRVFSSAAITSLGPLDSDPYVFSGFSSDPRICLVKSFAWLEMKLVLVHVVPPFRFLAIERPFEIESPSLTTRPSDTQLRFEKIE
ncbi:cytochrome p450 [Ophiostoma piceae UAMH 11346]|uniref:Cytochrome p450 n=1 Tax=Ophiostoma piceae (strain UAMH 11346) TaxID=1262450 RepID=S3CQY6_OPHP1|nr:cytochrome p450 [Ophiostoma piceae UAMH 11346]